MALLNRSKQARSSIFPERHENAVFTCVAERCRVIVFQATCSFPRAELLPTLRTLQQVYICLPAKETRHQIFSTWQLLSERLILAKPIVTTGEFFFIMLHKGMFPITHKHFFFNFTLQYIDISLNRETVLMTTCFQICHTNASFIQIAVSAKKYLCC